jgi:hypothetical protein
MQKPLSQTYVPTISTPPGLAALAILVVLLLLAGLGLRQTEPPAPAPASAPAVSFSAARAMDHLGHIASKPHPIGTAENAAVRDYLVAQLRELGYTPEVQSGVVVPSQGITMGHVNNVVVRIPGRAPGKALLLAAHYDSAPSSPGAADDGAAVAAILETLRALKHAAPLQNELICVLTDGEEAGLLGSRYFTRQAVAASVGMVLNFDFRGNSGPFWMFETSAGNGKLIDGFGTLDLALGNSLLAEVYRFMPNDTDFSAFKRAGMAGLNFAAIGHHNSYHTALDRADLLDQASLQHEGETMLALVRHFGNLPLSTVRAADRVYFNLPAAGMVSYPLAMVLPLSAVAVLALAALILLTVRAGQARGARLALATLAFVIVSVVVAVGCQLLWFALWLLHPGYQLQLHGNTYNGSWYLGAFTALGIGLYVLLLDRLQRYLRPAELSLGALLALALVLAAISVVAPGASFLLAWPMLAVVAALGCLLSRRGRAWPALGRALVLTLAAVPAVCLFAPLVPLMFYGLTPQFVAGTMLLLMLMLGAMTPLLLAIRQRWVMPFLPLVTALVLLVGGSASSGFDSARPRPDNLLLVQDGASHQAHWVSEDDRLDPWVRSMFPADPQKVVLKSVFGPNARPRWVAPAGTLPLQAPTIAILDDSRVDGLRRVTVEVRSLRTAPRMMVFVDGVAVQHAEVQGQPFAGIAGAPWLMNASGMGDEPLHLVLAVKPDVPFSIRARDISYGFQLGGVPARPPAYIAQPFRDSDTTQLTSIRHVD